MHRTELKQTTIRKFWDATYFGGILFVTFGSLIALLVIITYFNKISDERKTVISDL